MSLTNPNKPVTEARLAEFYQQILPYLGGMPEALANKFDKANLYSTDEKIVGCWTDGRPVYQKVLTGTMPTVPSGNVGASVNIAIGASVSKCIYMNGVFSIDTWWQPFFTTNDAYDKFAKLTVYDNTGDSTHKNRVFVTSSNNAWAGAPFYVIIQYTKTTDSANSFKYGSETDYSTDEHIIGTWTNGKPIYQKTVNIGVLSTTDKSVAHNITNMDLVISSRGFLKNGASRMNIPHTAPSDGSEYSIGVYVNDTNIVVQSRVARSSAICYVTLQYTKTTD